MNFYFLKTLNGQLYLSFYDFLFSRIFTGHISGMENCFPCYLFLKQTILSANNHTASRLTRSFPLVWYGQSSHLRSPHLALRLCLTNVSSPERAKINFLNLDNILQRHFWVFTWGNQTFSLKQHIKCRPQDWFHWISWSSQITWLWECSHTAQSMLIPFQYLLTSYPASQWESQHLWMHTRPRECKNK